MPISAGASETGSRFALMAAGREKPGLLPRGEEIAQKTRGEPRDREDDEQVPERVLQWRHRSSHEISKDGIGRHEESAEDRDQRRGESHAAAEGAHPLRMHRARDFIPSEILSEEMGAPGQRRATRGQKARRVVRDGRAAYARFGPAQRAERNRRRQREQIRRREE
jgi:hypothetical protein